MKIREETFTRPAKDGRRIIYIRIVDVETARVILTRSTRTTKKSQAKDYIRSLFASGEVEKAERMQREGLTAEAREVERIRAMPFARFVALFWSEDSPYLAAKRDAGAALSAIYTSTTARAAALFIEPHPAFGRVALRDISLIQIERFVRESRAAGKTPGQVNRALDAMQTPLSWAMKRGLVAEPFALAGIMRPKAGKKARGILNDEEVKALANLAAEDETKARKRLKKGEERTDRPAIDKRVKGLCLLALQGGLRRGEIRALAWADVDFEAGAITVRHSFTKADGTHAPKAGSFGTVPIPGELRAALLALLAYCRSLGRAAPEDYVLPNEERGKPIAEITIDRGFDRALRAIGIDEAEQRARNLVLHGGRHYFATRLADAIGDRAASRMTRHRSPAAFAGYADHTRADIIDQARAALDLGSGAGTAGQAGAGREVSPPTANAGQCDRRKGTAIRNYEAVIVQNLPG